MFLSQKLVASGLSSASSVSVVLPDRSRSCTGSLLSDAGGFPKSVFFTRLNYCMLLPGPEAQQLAIYIGWLLHRTWGGIVAGAFFVIPSVFVLLALSYVYAAHGNVSRWLECSQGLSQLWLL